MPKKFIDGSVHVKQLPDGFADRAGAVCKKGGGGQEGRVALGPMQACLSRRWEFSSKAAGARAQPQSSCGAAGRAGHVPPEQSARLGPACTPQSHEPATTAGAVGHHGG